MKSKRKCRILSFIIVFLLINTIGCVERSKLIQENTYSIPTETPDNITRDEKTYGDVRATLITQDINEILGQVTIKVILENICNYSVSLYSELRWTINITNLNNNSDFFRRWCSNFCNPPHLGEWEPRHQETYIMKISFINRQDTEIRQHQIQYHFSYYSLRDHQRTQVSSNILLYNSTRQVIDIDYLYFSNILEGT